LLSRRRDGAPKVSVLAESPVACFYRTVFVLAMSLGPTAKCFFCRGAYYVEKLASHEFVCSMRPQRLTVVRAVEMVVGSNPEASKDGALLVRLVWQVRDAYRTEQPFVHLTDPRLILAVRSKSPPKR
jgi:hypothetical protein